MLGPLGRRHVSVHICFKLLAFLKISMCVKHEFDSDGDFKRIVGDEDEVSDKVQNDELSKMTIYQRTEMEIEYLMENVNISLDVCTNSVWIPFAFRLQTVCRLGAKHQSTAPGTTPALLYSPLEP